jgi:hypothetical protein
MAPAAPAIDPDPACAAATLTAAEHTLELARKHLYSYTIYGLLAGPAPPKNFFNRDVMDGLEPADPIHSGKNRSSDVMQENMYTEGEEDRSNGGAMRGASHSFSQQTTNKKMTK